MSVVRVRVKILGGGGGWNPRWRESRFRRVHLIKLFLMNQEPHSGPRNLCKSYVGLIHNDIICNNKKVTKFQLFPSARLYCPPTLCLTVGLTKMLLILRGPLFKNYIFLTDLLWFYELAVIEILVLSVIGDGCSSHTDPLEIIKKFFSV